MNLTETPVTVTWPETHYVFVEKIGPFNQTAPQAWETLHTLTPALAAQSRITGYLSLYRIGPRVYRAGVALAAPPGNLPDTLRYEKFRGGRYAKFVLTGSYANLGKASGRVWELAQTLKLPLRDDYNIEHYVNDPRVTPEDQLITEIMFPVT